jgi:hypothetical protein
VEKALDEERIVAVGLLTQRDLDVLGQGFRRLWPVDQTPCFGALLQAIDEAERELRRASKEVES